MFRMSQYLYSLKPYDHGSRIPLAVLLVLYTLLDGVCLALGEARWVLADITAVLVGIKLGEDVCRVIVVADIAGGIEPMAVDGRWRRAGSGAGMYGTIGIDTHETRIGRSRSANTLHLFGA